MLVSCTVFTTEQVIC